MLETRTLPTDEVAAYVAQHQLWQALGLRTPELVVTGQEDDHARHAEAWAALGLRSVARDGLAADTLSALVLPAGLKPAEVVSKAAAQGVLIAGGLHPAIRDTYIRVGHMGAVIHRPADLERAVRAVASAVGAP